MMDFEDIFNMDWVSNEEVMNNDFSYFDNQQNNFMLDSNQQQQQEQVLVEPTTVTPIPTLDQIKHLIEIAKQQIALKEQEMQTAAPSVIFAPPVPVPVEDNNKDDASSVQSSDDFKSLKNEVNSQHSEETVTTLEAYAAADGIDLKKLSSKERRQLRNKLSARNFRVRRKEYITSLEEQVAEYKKTAENLRERLSTVEDENKILKREMDILKRQNQQLQQQQQATSSPRISSALPKPNINKDISLLGTKPTDSYRQQQEHHHNCILVSNAVMPAWDYESILAKKEDSILMRQLASHFLLFVVQIAQQQQKQEQRPLLPDEREFSPKTKKMEYLYDTLIQASLINNSTIDKSFLWSDNNTFVI
ncbi:hypothetical protein G6F57_003380 [Rhizopus arrhizus]|uniref:BZIP domain-containing protein n=1 Tax=Rhizopus oryzae TaxID=64495 RepID=A0A9P7BVD4_RHIOR|nr:hypothetical protein G6F23_000949 [Rhizopus arrhizus]KAG1414373.1 hypothetical protein G6F58_006992 [Rhizopus delemar]KAG0766325.1 hypothetical protein G6F24_003699 [Rhizopus arrhizus]KAG0793064.1 hypothetical protein G6F21_003891 [Rhizopus arrhizus]KAG0802280.1 hypothetical protein G6F22_000410 [Rhizopus arrhizus]